MRRTGIAVWLASLAFVTPLVVLLAGTPLYDRAMERCGLRFARQGWDVTGPDWTLTGPEWICHPEGGSESPFAMSIWAIAPKHVVIPALLLVVFLAVFPFLLPKPAKRENTSG